MGVTVEGFKRNNLNTNNSSHYAHHSRKVLVTIIIVTKTFLEQNAGKQVGQI